MASAGVEYRVDTIYAYGEHDGGDGQYKEDRNDYVKEAHWEPHVKDELRAAAQTLAEGTSSKCIEWLDDGDAAQQF